MTGNVGLLGVVPRETEGFDVKVRWYTPLY
jgi:hypothetical protein